jgi:hypothetical protein
MNDRRFLTVLNDALAGMPSSPLEAGAGRTEAEAIHLWADFLRLCVKKGVSVGDPRWHVLEVHRAAGRVRFRLPSPSRERAQTPDDFSVGLALLMAVLHPDESH